MITQAEIERLEASGYAVGDYGDFLELTDVERAEVELSTALVRTIRTARLKSGINQSELAKRIGSSQSRIAKIESGAEGVSLDLAFKALFALGGSLNDVVKEVRIRNKERIEEMKQRSKRNSKRNPMSKV